MSITTLKNLKHYDERQLMRFLTKIWVFLITITVFYSHVQADKYDNHLHDSVVKYFLKHQEHMYEKKHEMVQFGGTDPSLIGGYVVFGVIIGLFFIEYFGCVRSNVMNEYQDEESLL